MANKLTEVRFNRRYDAAQLLSYYTGTNPIPSDWTDGMFLQASNSPNRLYYFAKKTVNGQTAMAMTIVGEQNAVTGIKIQGGAALTGDVDITRASLDVYSTDEVNKKIEGAVSSLYTPKGDILKSEFEKLKYKDVKDGWVYNVKENADDKGKSYAAVKTPGYYRTNDPTNGRKDVDPDWVYPYTTQLAYFSAPANDCQAVAQHVRALIPGDAASDGFYVDVYMMADSTSGKYWLIGVNPDGGQYWLVPNETSPTLSGDDNYPYQAFSSKPDTAHISSVPYTSDGQQANKLDWSPMGGEFDTSGLAKKEEFDAFVADAKALHVRLENELNRILTQYDEVQNVALTELHEELDAVKSNFGKQEHGGVPIIGSHGWQNDDYLVTTDGSGNIVAVYKYGTAASRNTGLNKDNLPALTENITTSKQQGNYPAVYKQGGIGTTDKPLGSAAFAETTSDMTGSSNLGKLPQAGAVAEYVQMQMSGVQGQLVNVLVQQDLQFADKAELEEYVEAHIANIKPGYVYNVLDTDMNYAVRNGSQVFLGNIRFSFPGSKVLPLQSFSRWVEELTEADSIGEIAIRDFYTSSENQVSQHNQSCPLYLMLGAELNTVIPFVVFNTSAYYVSAEGSSTFDAYADGNIAPLPVQPAEDLLFLDPLGAEFDPKTLGTASEKDWGAGSGNVPVIGTALGGKNNYPVLLDSKGQLKPGSKALGDAAYKGVSSHISGNTTNLVTEEAVLEFANEAVDKAKRIILIGPGHDLFELLEEAPWDDSGDGKYSATLQVGEGEVSEGYASQELLDAVIGTATYIVSFQNKDSGLIDGYAFANLDAHTLPVTMQYLTNSGGRYVDLTVSHQGAEYRIEAYYDDVIGTSGHEKEWKGSVILHSDDHVGAARVAKQLAAKRSINGTLFDGTKNVSSFLAATDLGTSAGEYQFKCISADLTAAHGTRITVKFPEPNIEDGYKVMLYLSERSSSDGIGYPIFMDDAPVGARLTKGVYDLVLDIDRHGEAEPNGVWHIVSGGGGGRLYWED